MRASGTRIAPVSPVGTAAAATGEPVDLRRRALRTDRIGGPHCPADRQDQWHPSTARGARLNSAAPSGLTGGRGSRRSRALGGQSGPAAALRSCRARLALLTRCAGAGVSRYRSCWLGAGGDEQRDGDRSARCFIVRAVTGRLTRACYVLASVAVDLRRMRADRVPRGIVVPSRPELVAAERCSAPTIRSRPRQRGPSSVGRAARQTFTRPAHRGTSAPPEIAMSRFGGSCATAGAGAPCTIAMRPAMASDSASPEPDAERPSASRAVGRQRNAHVARTAQPRVQAGRRGGPDRSAVGLGWQSAARVHTPASRATIAVVVAALVVALCAVMLVGESRYRSCIARARGRVPRRPGLVVHTAR